MKIIYRSMACLLAAAAFAPQAAAQSQLPNAGFEEEWKDCVPWTFYISEGEQYGQQSEVVTGMNPLGWTISNVSGMASYNDGDPMGLGATVVGEETEGYESDKAVLLRNTPNPFMAAQIVPAYLTLGTSWSTANPAFQPDFSIAINNADGGTFGGVKMTDRPSGIEFMYKSNVDGHKNSGKSTVVAYLWKGHWTQKDVPVVVYMAGDPVLKDMTDRDRCVLGMDMTGLQGGEVTKTDDAELIAVLTGEITEDASDWTLFKGTFDYKSDATPEMFNLIIASGDYFGPASAVVKDDALIVDNVKLIYEEQGATTVYPGYLNVMVFGAPVTQNQASELRITDNGDNTCTILLPNLILDMGGDLLPIGDIKVENVAMKEDNGVTSFEGSVKNLLLLDGALTADVDLKGTLSNGELNMNIDVVSGGMEIGVTFTSKPTAVSALGVEDAPAEYFNLQGVRVGAESLAPGIYVKRQGNKAQRVIVK